MDRPINVPLNEEQTKALNNGGLKIRCHIKDGNNVESNTQTENAYLKQIIKLMEENKTLTSIIHQLEKKKKYIRK